MMTRFLFVLLGISGLVTSIYAQVPDTYWDGAEDTPPMDAYQQAGGYLRFTDYPVRVYLDMGASKVWEDAFADAIEELSTVMPIVQTHQPARADILIDMLSVRQFAAQTPCDDLHDDACSQMIPLYDPTDPNFRVISRIWIAKDSSLPPKHVLLHELLHALGLLVHSPYPDDVLYNQNNAAATTLSTRDKATLIYLYTQPAISQ